MKISALLLSFLFLFLASSSRAQLSPQYKELVAKGNELYNKKQYRESAMNYTKAFAANGDKGMPDDRYNAACSYSLAGEKDSAFKQLYRIAEKSNYSNLSHTTTDPDLEPLHSDRRWQALIAIVKQNKEKKEEGMNKPVIAILDTVMNEDQKYRMRLDGVETKYGVQSAEVKAVWKTIQEKDSVNLVKVKKILDTYGWLGPDEIGGEGNTTLFLVIQHSDLKEQEKYLPMMREAVKNKKAAPSSLALLEDRVALRNGKKQIYGSQVSRSNGGNGEYFVQPLEDPDHVDERRAAAGLQPLANYVKTWNIVWDVETYKKKLPEYEKEMGWK